jgi:pilus assembly protein CpaF
VYVDQGDGLELTDIRFPDDVAVRRLAQRLAGSVGRRLDDATPYADVRMRDGTRFHAVLAPLARPGSVISLRVPRARVFTLDELLTRGTINRDGASLLRQLVCSRLAFLVTGGTGSGKTTLLSAMLSLVDPAHRVVIVEDASELRPDHPHVVALEARPANVEGAGEIPMRVLVRQALRMRPDRLVVGEVRGAEVADLLAAMNTGHEGGCGTLHANSAADVPARVEALAMATGMPQGAVHSQLASAVDTVVHLTRDATGRRRVAELAVLLRDATGLVSAAPAVTFAADGTTREHPAAERLGERLRR